MTKRIMALCLALLLCVGVALTVMLCAGNDSNMPKGASDGEEESEVTFSSKEFAYDGRPKSIYVDHLPEDVFVTYTGNSQTVAGVYEVVATLWGNTKKYDLPKTMRATLTVSEGALRDADLLSASQESDTLIEREEPEDKREDVVGDYGREQDDLDKLNYLGATIYVLHWSDVQEPEFDIDRVSGDAVSDAVFERNSQIEERLNLQLCFESTPGNKQNRARFVQTVQVVADAGTKNYDLIATGAVTSGMLITQGLLYDLNAIEYSQLNLDKPWWPSQLIDTMVVGDSLYTLSGDISTNLLYQMSAVYVNKELFSQAFHEEALALGFTGDAEQGITPAVQMLYERAYSFGDQGGQWTLEAMISYAGSMYRDLNGNGRDRMDRYGLCMSKQYADVFYTGSNLQMIESNALTHLPTLSSDYSSVDAERANERLHTLLSSTAYFEQSELQGEMTPFEQGNALFTVGITADAPLYTPNANFNCGILPIPKLDGDQLNYYTRLGDEFTVFGISRHVQEKTDIGYDKEEVLSMLTAVLECWGSMGYRITTPAIFERELQIDCSDTQYETDMLEYIRGSVVYDKGQFFGDALSFPCDAFVETAYSGVSWQERCEQLKQPLQQKLDALVQALSTTE